MGIFIAGMVVTLLLSSCADDIAESEQSQQPPVDDTINSAAGDASVAEITWWELLSAAEQEFWDEELDKYESDPSYISDRTPPEPAVNPDVDGTVVRIPGYVVGIDVDPDDFGQASSILFVPYQGACIHVPPPPENQTIFAETSEAVSTNPFVPYWLTGTLRVESGENELASYSYVVEGARLEEYVWTEDGGSG
jgi:hypothetical protein